jgi:hypothetical protein
MRAISVFFFWSPPNHSSSNHKQITGERYGGSISQPARITDDSVDMLLEGGRESLSSSTYLFILLLRRPPLFLPSHHRYSHQISISKSAEESLTTWEASSLRLRYTYF